MTEGQFLTFRIVAGYSYLSNSHVQYLNRAADATCVRLCRDQVGSAGRVDPEVIVRYHRAFQIGIQITFSVGKKIAPVASWANEPTLVNRAATRRTNLNM